MKSENSSLRNGNQARSGSALTQTRAEILEEIRHHPETTFCVIGAGIHGAECARIIARNGHTCVLLERFDYASGTSSRSSKMAHGGLRYLEMLDFQQVAEGLQARDDLFQTARHLCQPARFLVPVSRGDWWFRFKLGMGMTLYDHMGMNRSLRHRYLRRSELDVTGFQGMRHDLAGCYEYWDGLLHDDARLVIESVLDARMHGARCLNHMEAVSVSPVNGRYLVVCKDRLEGGDYEILADMVINCAGPWVQRVAPCEEDLASHLRFSVGVHLLFDQPWIGPCLFLPMSERGRYYFVWPHPSGGTMVGTTEREVDFPDDDPIPTAGEVEEIIGRLQRDLPEAELNRKTVYYGFAGIRVLPLRGNARGTARLSRKHIWKWTRGGLALLGGKLTTARWTAWEGYRRAVEHLGLRIGRSLDGVAYPGSGTEIELREIELQLIRRGVFEERAHHLVSQYGIRAVRLLEGGEWLEPITACLYRGEVELALREEQAATIEDILRRRTGVEYHPGDTNAAVDGVIPLMAQNRELQALEQEAHLYRQRLSRLRQMLKGGNT